MTSNRAEKRRALRVQLNAPTVIEPIGQPEVALHENLEKVYRRVAASKDRVGDKIPGVVRDLSTNGASSWLLQGVEICLALRCRGRTRRRRHGANHIGRCSRRARTRGRLRRRWRLADNRAGLHAS